MRLLPWLLQSPDDAPSGFIPHVENDQTQSRGRNTKAGASVASGPSKRGLQLLCLPAGTRVYLVFSVEKPVYS